MSQFWFGCVLPFILHFAAISIAVGCLRGTAPLGLIFEDFVHFLKK